MDSLTHTEICTCRVQPTNSVKTGWRLPQCTTRRRRTRQHVETSVDNVRRARSPRDAKLAMDAGLNSISADTVMAGLWIEAGALDLEADGGLSYEPCEGRVPERLIEVEPAFADVLDELVAQDAHALFVDDLCQTIGGSKHRIPWAI